MKFPEFKAYLRDHGLTFRTEGWSGCIQDTIIVERDGKDIFTGPYDRWVDYADYVKAIESGDPGGEM
ncbi:MAG: hypothetical protein IJS22_09865 [Lachnospiraceae bacterium]|nr:hypothetical protein [Lachnospiraceae bacterium]